MQDDNLFLGNNYDLPVNRDEFIDTKSGEVVGQDKIEPFDVIKKLAEKTGTQINDPKENCKKCWGRGFIGRDAKTKAPIPCKCIFPKLTGEELQKQQEIENRMRPLSRKEKRYMIRKAKKMAKKQKKNDERLKNKKEE